ncbi:MAG: TerB family tellurite resistance protein [Elusimicrobiota bacterium]|nr:MAG: TerB family tellurite resistance protein [Elusimicrobiota bacterium]
MSVEALEDRVSVLFWRRVDPYLDDAAVGVVDLGVMERDKDWSRAHVRVRWSASGFARTEVFIMKRAASAVTDARQGLRTARCPACGAPPAIAEPAACAYCGAPADDGRRDWVLDRVVSFEAWRRPPALSAPAPVAAAAWKPLSPMAAFEAMAAVMVSDGEVSLGERAALDAFARARGLPAERTVEVLAAARAGALDVPAAENGEQAAAIIRSMARIGLADGVVNQRERGVLVAYAARYGLTPDDVSAIVQAERGAMSA